MDLFFILSGFILSHVNLSRWEARTFNYGSFLWTRLARIYPVHLVTLAAMIAIWLVAAVLVALGFFALIFWAVESHGLPLPEVTRLGSSRLPAGRGTLPARPDGLLPRRLALGGAAAVIWTCFAASMSLSDAVIWPAFGLLIFALAEVSKTSARGITSAAWLVYLGEVSYSVYMTHLPVDIAYFHALDRLAPDISGPAAWVAWGGVFVATLLAAWRPTIWSNAPRGTGCARTPPSCASHCQNRRTSR